MGCSVTQNSGRSMCMKLYCILNFDPPSLSFLLRTQLHSYSLFYFLMQRNVHAPLKNFEFGLEKGFIVCTQIRFFYRNKLNYTMDFFMTETHFAVK